MDQMREPATATANGGRRSEAELDSMVRECLPLVGYIVNEMAVRLPGHVRRDDLLGAAMAGLAQAASTFDCKFGVPFRSYASPRIRGAVLDELRAMDWASRGARSRGRQVSESEAALSARLQRSPTSQELASELGIGLADLDRWRQDSERELLSLDLLTVERDVQPISGAPDPAAVVERNERIGYLHAAIRELPERLQAVARGVYFELRPMAEIAAELEVSESRVSQMRAEAVELLRHAMGEQFHNGPPPESCDGVSARRRAEYSTRVAQRAVQAGLRTHIPRQTRAALDAYQQVGGNQNKQGSSDH